MIILLIQRETSFFNTSISIRMARLFSWWIVSAIINLSESIRLTITEHHPFVECPSGTACHVHCEGTESCMGSVINCPENAPCTVQCDGIGSCYESIIFHGGDQSKMNIHCNAENSCRNAVIDAIEAEEFTMTGCEDTGSCIGVTLYCPPITDGQPKCAIHRMHSSYSSVYVIR